VNVASHTAYCTQACVVSHPQHVHQPPARQHNAVTTIATASSIAADTAAFTRGWTVPESCKTALRGCSRIPLQPAVWQVHAGGGKLQLVGTKLILAVAAAAELQGFKLATTLLSHADKHPRPPLPRAGCTTHAHPCRRPTCAAPDKQTQPAMHMASRWSTTEMAHLTSNHTTTCTGPTPNLNRQPRRHHWPHAA
jgi:hypothetical protein